jgi:hypothetical protein
MFGEHLELDSCLRPIVHCDVTNELAQGSGLDFGNESESNTIKTGEGYEACLTSPMPAGLAGSDLETVLCHTDILFWRSRQTGEG